MSSNGEERHKNAFDIRKDAAEIAFKRRYDKKHRTNGEEDDYRDADNNRNFIANYTKGLKHHEIGNRDAGEVKNEDYKKFLKALKSGKQKDFDDIPLGIQDGRKLKNPQAGYSFDLEGPDSHDLTIRAAPRIDEPEAAGEMAELYWMALCRDIEFLKFGTDPLILNAVDDLSKGYSDFPANPKFQITPKTIFRGFTVGDHIGPYISQFLYKDITWGPQTLHQVQPILKKKDYLTDYLTWLKIQDGFNQDTHDERETNDTNVRLITTPRDLCFYVHVDALYQAYLGACLILLHNKYKFDPLLPYEYEASKRKDEGFGTFGDPHILSLVTEVATRALKAVWFQKWIVHRRLRPEAFGGLIHRQLNSTLSTPTPNLTSPNPSYKIHQDILGKTGPNQVLERIKVKNNNISYLLPQAFPEGSPMHPSYGAGHATVAGACVTVLKAWFKEDEKIKNPEIPDMNNPKELVPYTEVDKNDLTVGGELNKVAANIAIGRNWAGVHYRSDYTESLKLGERIAIGILQEQALTCNEKFACTLTKFEGKEIEFSKTRIIEH
jgi:hypothetical protein